MHFKEARGLLSANNGMNIYRGCCHGCVYCDSRSKCYGMEHDFEDVEVKINAPELLERALRSKRRRCMIATGSMSDPYQPLEAELGLTRRCAEIIAREGFGFTPLTKSELVLRDLDLLETINRGGRCVVQMTLTTFDEGLCSLLEPYVSSTLKRFEALMALKRAGIATVVWISPLLPFINDSEQNLNGLLDLCFEAGVRGIINFGMGLTLREGNREYFYAALERHFPGMSRRYTESFGNSYMCESPNAPALERLLRRRCGERGVMLGPQKVFDWLSELDPDNCNGQTSLF